MLHQVFHSNRLETYLVITHICPKSLTNVRNNFLNVKLVQKGFTPSWLASNYSTSGQCFLKWANPGLFLFIFVLFSLQYQYKLKKAQMVCLGFEPGAAGWKAQMKPWSYGGHPTDVMRGSMSFIERRNYLIFQNFSQSYWCCCLKQNPVVLTTHSTTSVTRKKSPNVYKSCPKMISLKKIDFDNFTKSA